MQYLIRFAEFIFARFQTVFARFQASENTEQPNAVCLLLPSSLSMSLLAHV